MTKLMTRVAPWLHVANLPAIPGENWPPRTFRNKLAYRQFLHRFDECLRACNWEPHPKYSVFTQYDQSFYLSNREGFTHKYRCFYAVSRAIAPRRIIELGTHAGSSADAYLSATPTAEYIGFDQFEEGERTGVVHEVNGVPWRPREIAEKLFEDRGFTRYQLIKADLRAITKLPFTADFVVVDAAHDFRNEYEDLKLALTAGPRYIWVDDYGGAVIEAVDEFLRNDLNSRVGFTRHIQYVHGGGLIIKV